MALGGDDMANIEKLEKDVYDIKLFLLTLDNILRQSGAYKDAKFNELNFITQKINQWDSELYGEGDD